MNNEVIEAVPSTSSLSPVTAEGDPVKPDLEVLIGAATLSNYQEVLGEIATVEDAVVLDAYLAKLAKKLNTAKPILAKALAEHVKSSSSDIDAEEALGTKVAAFPGLVDLVRDEAGKVSYLIKQDDGLHLAKSWTDPNGELCIPPELGKFKIQLPDAARVMSLYDNAEEDHRLYEDLLTFFNRFSYLEDEVWPIIIFSVFLSYMQDHHDVRYIPGIYFYAVAERGKSRTAKTMVETSYRGLTLTDIRPANIVRFAERLNATLYFDVTDLWATAEKGDGCDILLNRFEKGGSVARVLNPDKGPFDDQTFFSVYGSTIYTTNQPANSIFESRCLSITMPNRPGHYENLIPGMGLTLKDRLTAWRARMMDKHLPQVDPVPGIGGRLWDISQPIFQLANLIAPETFEMIKKVILGLAGQKVENKRETIEGKIVDAIDDLVVRDAPEPWEVTVAAIGTKVNGTITNDKYHYTPQRIGRVIESLSIAAKKVNGRSRVIITEKELNLLKAQYGLLQVSPPAETLQLSTTRQDDAPTATDAGRESLEGQELATNSPDEKITEVQDDRRVVEGGRELADPTTTDTELHDRYLKVIQGGAQNAGKPGPTEVQPEERIPAIIKFPDIKKARQAEAPLAEERPKAQIRFGRPR